MRELNTHNTDIIIDFSQEGIVQQPQDVLYIADILNILCKQLTPRGIKNLSFVNNEIYKIFQSSSQLQVYLAFICDQLFAVYEQEKELPFDFRERLINALNCTGQEFLKKTKRNSWTYHKNIDYFRQLMLAMSEIEKKENGQPQMGLLAITVFCGDKKRFELEKINNVAQDAKIWRKGRILLALFLTGCVVQLLCDFFNSPHSNLAPLLVALSMLVSPLIWVTRSMMATGPSNPETPTCLFKDNQYLFFKPDPEPKMGFMAQIAYLNNNDAFEHAKRVERHQSHSKISRYGRLIAFIFSTYIVMKALYNIGETTLQPEVSKPGAIQALLIFLTLSIYLARKIVATGSPNPEISMENNQSLSFKINNVDGNLEVERSLPIEKNNKGINGLNRRLFARA